MTQSMAIPVQKISLASLIELEFQADQGLRNDVKKREKIS
jgi:hypothetical protein